MRDILGANLEIDKPYYLKLPSRFTTHRCLVALISGTITTTINTAATKRGSVISTPSDTKSTAMIFSQSLCIFQVVG